MAYVTTRRRRAPARKRRRTRRKNPRFGRHRPVLIYGAGGWRRPRRKRKVRSMIAPRKRSVRINRKRLLRRLNPFTSASARRASMKRWYGTPRRRYRRRRNPVRVNRRRRRTYRRNPNILGALTSRRTLFMAAKIGGGMVAGFVALPMVYRYLPDTWKTETLNKWKGGINVLLGALMVGLLRNRDLKEVGMVIAATGVYDMVAQNVPMLGLPGISLTTPLLAEKTSASYGARRLPISPAARAGRMAASYNLPARMMGASYERNMRSSALGGDNPFADIEGYE